MKRILTEPFDLEAVQRALVYPEEGGQVLFLGSVRDQADAKEVVTLHYEAYVEMAEASIRRIEEEVREATQVRRVLVLHRIGDLRPGEKTILVAAVARHRQAAFAACREALERVKAEAPVWKKEIYADGGATWVRHRPAEEAPPEPEA